MFLNNTYKDKDTHSAQKKKKSIQWNTAAFYTLAFLQLKHIAELYLETINGLLEI